MDAQAAKRLQEGENARAVLRDTGETTRANLNASSQAGIAAANRAMQEKIAGMPSDSARTAMLLGTGKTDQERLESGMRKAQEISENPKIIIQEYAKHRKAAEDAIPPRIPMTAEEFAEQSQILIAAMKNKRNVNPAEEALVNKHAPKQ